MRYFTSIIAIIIITSFHSLYGQSPIPKDDGASYIYAPGTIATPSITESQLHERLNEFNYNGKLKRQDWYLTMLITIDRNGKPTYFEVYKCKTFPSCDNMLKNKRILRHLYESINENVCWKPGVYEGKIVNSRGLIKTRLSNGKMEILSIE